MAKELFKSNANALAKVLTQLDFSQTMTHKMVLLKSENQAKLKNAADKIRDAIQILRTIQSQAQRE